MFLLHKEDHNQIAADMRPSICDVDVLVGSIAPFLPTNARPAPQNFFDLKWRHPVLGIELVDDVIQATRLRRSTSRRLVLSMASSAAGIDILLFLQHRPARRTTHRNKLDHDVLPGDG